MADTEISYLERFRAARDAKLAPVLPDEEPVWLVEEDESAVREQLHFAIISRWDGVWKRRRYLYDPVGNVLHFRGERLLSHDERSKLKPEQQYRPMGT